MRASASATRKANSFVIAVARLDITWIKINVSVVCSLPFKVNIAVLMKNLVSTYLGQIDIFISLESLNNFAAFYLSLVSIPFN